MSDIVISSANKHGSRELSSGDFLLSFHVDRTLAKEILPLYLVGQEAPLKLVISDSDHSAQDRKKVEKSDQQIYREKLYARIQIHADEIGYSEGAMRMAFKNITGKESRKDMTDQELETVEKEFYLETQPPVEEA